MAKAISTLLIAVCLTCSGVFAASLWNDTIQSPYSVQRPYRAGDVLMVLVVETTSAVQKAGTDTANQDSLAFNFTHTIERLNPLISPSSSLQGNISNSYKGTGSTNRSSNVLATVAVKVKEVLPNGDLSVAGVHKVSVNEETQEITISGTVRPADITAWNTVYSYQVADSHVAIKGSGTVGEVSAPGIITRLLNIIF